MDNIREVIYPLGFIATILFGGRFLLQWFESEWKRASVVSPLFWKLSLAGNSSLLVHALLQGQLPVVLFQTINGIISWRNLDLRRPREQQRRLLHVFLLFGFGTLCTLVFYAYVQWLFDGGEWQWYRIPKAPWSRQVAVSTTLWDVIGFLGLGIFSSRFWFQWWGSEWKQKSHIGPFFWWYSLAGGVMTTLYFAKIHDWVQLVGPALGLIPYMRNLVFLHRKKRTSP